MPGAFTGGPPGKSCCSPRRRGAMLWFDRSPGGEPVGVGRASVTYNDPHGEHCRRATTTRTLLRRWFGRRCRVSHRLPSAACGLAPHWWRRREKCSNAWGIWMLGSSTSRGRQTARLALADLWLEVSSAGATARYAADTCARGDADTPIATALGSPNSSTCRRHRKRRQLIRRWALYSRPGRQRFRPAARGRSRV
jgi:hypothetical protein